MDGVVALVEKITAARRGVSDRLRDGSELRGLLYLDLALEQLLRVAVERNLHQHLSGDQLADLIGWVLENVTLSEEEPELGHCLRQWKGLLKLPLEQRWTAGWSLHAKSVVDRVGRALADWTDRLYRVVQPKAEFLGQSFHAEGWTISLFSEEVVRGSSLGFALSMLLHQVGRVLRRSAHLGDWQIVSRGEGAGRVEVVDTLRAVQGQEFKSATVVIADKVMGDEELPKEVVTVIAPDVTDLVSHVAVRARNAQILFASCSDPGVLEHLKGLRGRFLHVKVTAAGDVAFTEVAPAEQGTTAVGGAQPVWTPQRLDPNRGGAGAVEKLINSRPRFTKFAVGIDEFNVRILGGKSCSQARLRGRLPAWIRQPASAALPFGCFENVLQHEINRSSAERYRTLTGELQKEVRPDTLRGLRESVESLTAPEELKTTLRDVLAKSGLAWPEDWGLTWHCIKQVWASKWNERAVLSRKTMGIPDDALFMAVLVQPVVEAEYAFVVHTVNPSNNNRDELYGEVVLGLGETLVGNFPGRALSFVWDKRSEQIRVLSFPSKSVGLYGGGLIFRSDSNGEDLAGYAGAGLYDSVLQHSPRRVELDYSNEPLLWDEDFRNGLLAAISRIGIAAESALGSPQDIEGAVAKGEYFVVQTRPQVGLENL
jgi:alpha-glucan,water dikinase